eukprot:7378606-Prymnesium_polylepis.1
MNVISVIHVRCRVRRRAGVQGPGARARRESANKSDWHNHKMEDDGATLDELWAALDAAEAAVA